MDDQPLSQLDPRLVSRLAFLARKAGIPEQECSDLVQEALSAAVKQLRGDSFRGDSSLGTWLQAILRAKIADYWRVRKRQAIVLREPSTRLDCDDRTEHCPWIAGFPDRIPRPEIVLSVRKALDRLEATHRLVLLLNQYGGYTCEEIARKLGRPAGTVGRMLAEAKERFRELYRAEDPRPLQRLIRGAGQ